MLFHLDLAPALMINPAEPTLMVTARRIELKNDTVYSPYRLDTKKIQPWGFFYTTLKATLNH